MDKEYLDSINFDRYPAIGATDSDEETFFEWWMTDLIRFGVIESYEAQPDPFLLSSRKTYVKVSPRVRVPDVEKDTILMHGHHYTCDYKIVWGKNSSFLHQGFPKKTYEKGLKQFISHKNADGKYVSYVEVKPIWDMENMTRLFRINQKWVYDKLGLYVNLVKIGDKANALFAKTFTPSRYVFTNVKRQERKTKHFSKVVEEYLFENIW